MPPSATVARPRLILASESPRRLALLRQIGIEPDAVLPAALDESPRQGELPRPCAQRLAREKGAAIAAGETTPALVLAADTIVALGRRILPKAETEEQARRCLALLSGRRHTVVTAVTLTPGGGWEQGRACERVVETSVAFSRLSAKQIDALIEQGDWRGKAGGYAIQGMAAAFIRQIGGSYSAVMGLPLFETAQLLRGQPGGWLA
ncbi:Maf family protein [Acidomonas methanolica]|uniref:dTTP/UTP pyrophosphatase n=1 Tax=Acidomonas methanolica NBRC 104435 TaxID=1231351 RepID=A0A023D4A2_ACIMT|nr:Maf family protein [Acidomonas methanolica]MBU2653728.1 septum formation protein Maf [Acidomonas methanolica]TCS31680.1 septum formation protein [Acidomonas methanolica]GAJ28894.1 cell division inhibitor/septum formation inhibitor nucleotide-binding protein Maf [Acidomonas methanolica NBRC 104435]GBQ48300.1 septum formation inhibitor nucleotide-binding protein Maf [Acidomonas methanolica]GEK98098.1 Maf-like protein [Acidomonas methanolica NBRC 104435]